MSPKAIARAEQPADRLALALQAAARMIRHDRQH